MNLKVRVNSYQRRIHERIHDDLPAFKQQLAASKSVQDRLSVLTTSVENVETSLSGSSVSPSCSVQGYDS